MARLPPAPGRYSTMICCPRISLTAGMIVRSRMSAPPPAAKPWITLIGWSGYAACATVARHSSVAATMRTTALMTIGVASPPSRHGMPWRAARLCRPHVHTAARILELDAATLTQALGIAGSLCGGLLAFAQAGNGAMVKRLHLGRAAEAGILAARRAQRGFEGPD